MAHEIELEHRYRGENPVRTLWYLFESERAKLAIAIFFFFLKYSPAWIIPLTTANIIDVVVAGGPASTLWINLAVMAFSILQNLPNHMLHVHFLSRAVRTVENRLRSAVAQRMQMMSMGFYHRTNAAVLQTKVVRDVENIEMMLRNVTEGGLSAIFGLSGAIVATAIKVPVFLPFFFVVVPLSGALIIKLRSSLSARNEEFRESVEFMSSRVNEMTTLLPFTRAHGLEKRALERVDESFKEVRSAGLRLDAFNARYNATAWVVFQVSNVLCLAIAGYASITQLLPITTGEIVLLTTYFGMLTGSIVLISSLMPSIAKGLESVKSLGEVLESPDVEENDGKDKINYVRGDFSFKNVSYTYVGSSDPALEALNLEVNAGQTVALVGESGSGKSTFINLVIGFLRASSGSLELDGRKLTELDLRSYRRFVSVVPQDSVLFSGSIRDNVTYGVPQLTDAAVWQALEDAYAREFVEALPNGLDTRLGDEGVQLSGGQKQRIAIARALVRDPRVLILDEATSSLDAVSEESVQNALDRLMNGRTSFVVAHRLSTVRRADLIIVLDHGRIAESGLHDELVSAGGLYTKLLETQTRA